MKIYFIDTTGRNIGIQKQLEQKGIENIEMKDSYFFRATKNDYVIVSEFRKEDDNSFLKKYSNLIVITEIKDKEILEMLANNEKVIDIIFRTCEEDYIATRIQKLLA